MTNGSHNFILCMEILYARVGVLVVASLILSCRARSGDGVPSDGIRFADGYAVGFDPGVCAKGTIGEPGAPCDGSARYAACRRRGERPKQTTLLAAASAAYRTYGVAVTLRHVGIGWRIPFGPRFKPAAELSDSLSFHPSSDNDGNQRHQAVVKVDACGCFRL